MAGRKQETQLRTAGGIQYELTRKRVKNLNIRVREDGTVAVSIPLRTSCRSGRPLCGRTRRLGAAGPGTCHAARSAGSAASAG
ncbi:MAG: hypothetical protein V8R95_10470 [Faecalibacterium sp.]